MYFVYIWDLTFIFDVVNGKLQRHVSKSENCAKYLRISDQYFERFTGHSHCTENFSTERLKRDSWANFLGHNGRVVCSFSNRLRNWLWDYDSLGDTRRHFPYFQDGPTTRAIKWNGTDSSWMAAGASSLLPSPVICFFLSFFLLFSPFLAKIYFSFL